MVHGRVLDAKKERRKVPYPDETGGTADGIMAERKMCSDRLVRSKLSLLRSKGALLLIRPGARKRLTEKGSMRLASYAVVACRQSGADLGGSECRQKS